MAALSDNERQLAILQAKDKAKQVRKMESGAMAGLLSGAELAADVARVQAEEDARFAAMDAVALGRDAAVVLRDRKGRVVSKATLVRVLRRRRCCVPRANGARRRRMRRQRRRRRRRAR
jgi:hypothetical protein